MARPNIILVTLDGLRADAIGCAGEFGGRTPNIDALAASGVRFENAITPFPEEDGGGWACLSGESPEFPPTEGARPATPNAPWILPDHLRETGYDTCAAVATQPDSRATAFAAVRAPTEESHEADLAAWIGDQAVRFCQVARAPFFLWAAFPALRLPFNAAGCGNPIPPAKIKIPPDLAPDAGARPRRAALYRRRALLAGYHAAIAHADRQLGRLLATLTARGHTNNVIVMTSGHGLDHASLEPEHDPPATRLTDPRLRAPLIIAGLAGQRRNAVETALVSVADIVPALLEISGVDAAAAPRSRPLLPLLAGKKHAGRPFTTFQGAGRAAGVRTPRYKWVVLPGGLGEMLYDLQVDPREMHNLWDSRRATAIRRMLLGIVQREARIPP
ncbi:MAG: sulfatase-like hydrolase/transferase [Candidatus Hydrogenedentes bacterium]|nr:sulfatase-like hydrolase/transferase [Candidatus Hydrogenedentota bacterium]